MAQQSAARCVCVCVSASLTVPFNTRTHLHTSLTCPQNELIAGMFFTRHLNQGIFDPTLNEKKVLSSSHPTSLEHEFNKKRGNWLLDDFLTVRYPGK